MTVHKPNMFRCILLAITILFWSLAFPALTSPAQIDSLLSTAKNDQESGRLGEAFAILEKALALAKATNDEPRQALVLTTLSDTYLLSQYLEKAAGLAQQSVSIARQTTMPLLLATTLNQLGNVMMAEQRYQDALSVYREALLLAEQSFDQPLVINLLTNTIHVYLATDMLSEAVLVLKSALAKTQELADSREKLFGLIALGYLAQRIQLQKPNQRAEMTEKAYAAFSEALALAETLSDIRAKSYAIGHLAELYFERQRYPETEQLLSQALFFAEQIDAPELSARWQWQLGRLRKVQGKQEEAIAAYGQALDHLQLIQPALVFGQRGNPQSFRETIGLIYLELAELLLQKASTAVEKVQQDTLRKIRDVMEDFKAVELKNYFRDYCVAAQQEKNKALQLDSLMTTGTATLYPVVFSDRTVLLLSLTNGEIKYATVPVTANKLRQTAEAFRSQMNPSSNPRRLLKNGQRLYDWLIKPVEKVLKSLNIHMLVVVPDGVLRTIPFAALHDGKEFLVNHYAVAVTPGLMLTDPSGFTRGEQRLLVNGLSESVQGFDGLPYVSTEVEKIASIYGGKQLIDEGFVKSNVIEELKRVPYSVVSFSTHGFFHSNPKESFVLTYDDKLTFDELERLIRISEFRDQPVELIVLSACETAVGDDRAALGLAGVALKAGARSAMASLWAVNDHSTAVLVPAFFEKLKDPALSKAQALQQAQLKLLSDPRTKHPYYWAAFVVIGNWF